MGITLLVNPSCPYPVIPIPSGSPYVFSCQVSSLLIHCVYAPPSLTDDEFMSLITALPMQTHPSQKNAILCGDLNARSVSLLGDTRTNTRGSRLGEWIEEAGLFCWNALLARGVPTLSSQSRLANSQPGHTSWNSVIDLFISYSDLVNTSLVIRENSLGSDHVPVTLTCSLQDAPPPPVAHPRVLWKMSVLDEHKSAELYKSLFRVKVSPIKNALLAEVKYSLELYARNNSRTSTHAIPFQHNREPPDVDRLADRLTEIIHYCLDHSVGRKKPPRPPGNARFWTDRLQSLVDSREDTRRAWKRAPDGVGKAVFWKEYVAACDAFTCELKRRRRETWKQFCDKLSNGDFAETTTIIKRMRRNRTMSPGFSHPEGPATAATVMSSHLRSVFAGDQLPDLRPSAPPLPNGPCLTRHDILYLCSTFDITVDSLVSHPIDKSELMDNISDSDCPFSVELVTLVIIKRLARRKAPGVDHIRTEMLLPILNDLAPVLVLLFSLCWIWSRVPKTWCTAQVIPIFKKGDPLDAANYRPISLTSVMRKVMELCLYPGLLDSAPTHDIVQGGFRANRGTLDQALALHEICRQHTIDHMGEPPVLCFLDIKQAYDSVDRNIIWRALETHVPDALLGILQCLFDNVRIEALVSGARSPTFWPGTGVLQGSILSPFLYSVYINSLPAALRSISMPSSRVFGTMPQRKYNGLWINSLLYADDVVLIGTAETMPRLLKKAEEHSLTLGYRWNPLKSVVVNAPLYTGRATPLRLYGSNLPTADSFIYLGLPFNTKGQLDTSLLVQRNARSTLVAMRSGIQPFGFHSPSFSRLTSARIYTTFIRPKLEYGLAISTFLVKDHKVIEKAQDQCLRLCFGGHSKASTMVFKHMTGLPSMRERIETLGFKMLVRMNHLPADTLIGSLLPHLKTSPVQSRFRWPALIKSNKIWHMLCFPAGAPPIPVYRTIEHWISSSGDVKISKIIFQYRQMNLRDTLAKVDAPVLLRACRPVLGIDPILTLPMTVFERSRLLRWRMGWLPARPVACSRCGASHASRNHLIACLSVANRLGISADTKPNPLDYVINQLPVLKEAPSFNDQRYAKSLVRWSNWWPVLCSIMVEMDMICLPGEEFSELACDSSGSTFLEWLLPIYYLPVALAINSSLYNYV
jgi:hypothetical protein